MRMCQLPIGRLVEEQGKMSEERANETGVRFYFIVVLFFKILPCATNKKIEGRKVKRKGEGEMRMLSPRPLPQASLPSSARVRTDCRGGAVPSAFAAVFSTLSKAENRPRKGPVSLFGLAGELSWMGEAL